MKSAERKNAESDFDLRVRERHLQRGVLDAKAIEKYLAELRDVASQCEPVGIPQPAHAAGGDEGEG